VANSLPVVWRENPGVALRAGLLRAPHPLGPGKPVLLRTLHIPNA
jgi:hypothetical protein